MSISKRFWKSRFPPMMTVSRPSEFNRYRSGTFTSKVSPVGKTTWATHGSAPLSSMEKTSRKFLMVARGATAHGWRFPVSLSMM